MSQDFSRFSSNALYNGLTSFQLFDSGGMPILNSFGVVINENVASSSMVFTPSMTGYVGSVNFAFAGGLDDNKFSLNPQTGALSFLTSPDYEAPKSSAWSNTYVVKLQASDSGGNVVVQTVWIEVQDIDDEAPIFVDGASSQHQVPSNLGATEVVYAPVVSDNVGVTAFAFAGGADDNMFNLDFQTGALRFLSPPSYDMPRSAAWSNTYTVKLKAIDAAGNSTVQSVQIEVQDAQPPVFSQGGSAHVDVNENVLPTTVVYTPVVGDNVGIVGFAFAGGVDDNKFSLDVQSAAVRFLDSPNYEMPASALASNTYEVKLKARDSVGNVSLQTVQVQVQNVDDEAPLFAQGSIYQIDVNENVTTTAVVYAPVISDNIGVTGFVFAGGPDDNKFSLNAQSGALRFLTSPDYERPSSESWSNTYKVMLQARDAAGNVAVQALQFQVHDVDDVAPIFTLGASAQVNCNENVAPTQPVYMPAVYDNVGIAEFAFAGGADDSKFSLDITSGALSFVSSPNYEIPSSVSGTNTYEVKLNVSDAAGNTSSQTVLISVLYQPLTTENVFDLWQQVDHATQGDSNFSVNALQNVSAEIVTTHDAVSKDGSANQIFQSLRQSEYINAVTDTDIVNSQEYQAGFSIAGHAAAGLQSSIKFLLDNDRTDGVNGQSAKRLSIGANDTNGDGIADLVINYDDTSGDWSMVFSPHSIALKAATIGTWGSGVHQLVVDDNGDGVANNNDANRLFLVAAGTAQLTDGGSIGQNYSVQDKVTGDVFVYYAGDPDGTGVGLWSMLNADAIVPDGVGIYDFQGVNYYIHSANPSDMPSNLAAHMSTAIDNQVWEFHTAQTNQLAGAWSDANFLSENHVLNGSNTSRLASLQEMVALYAANFGQNDAGSDGGSNSHVPGAIQALSSTIANSGYTSGNDNLPGGWPAFMDGWEYPAWVAATTPSGHALVSLTLGQLIDATNVNSAFVPVVL